MTKTRKTAGSILGTSAAALALLLGASLAAEAGTGQSASPYPQLAAQQLKAPARGPGPVRPLAPKRMVAKPGTAANDSYGCHDNASMTSYEGPCDYYPEYESTGGCESSAEQASVPGNCPNSSEP